MTTQDSLALDDCKALRTKISNEIKQCAGFISFSRFMELALYTPQLGYYSGPASKFGSSGDFVTAPEISPLFGQTIAEACRPWLQTFGNTILEIGAGTGQLAAQILNTLSAIGCPPDHYWILERSGTLRAQQQATLASQASAEQHKVRWLDTLPNTMQGVILGNELLDALPVDLFSIAPEGIMERGVKLGTEREFTWAERPASPTLCAAVEDIQATLPAPLPIGYQSEVCLAADALTHSLADCLTAGVLCLLDYGFPRTEYYHPQRGRGTLMCHYRQRAHPDPFFMPGLQDITAHVDFTRIALAANAAGLDVLGYTSQAHFLLNCGIGEWLMQTPTHPIAPYAQASAAVQKLTSEAEMGELFKVLACVKDPAQCLHQASITSTCMRGFARGDRSHRL